MKDCGDAVVEAVRDRLRARSIAGQAKYGHTMERADLTRARWLRHAQEEALDLAVYLERLLRDEERALAIGVKIADNATRDCG